MSARGLGAGLVGMRVSLHKKPASNGINRNERIGRDGGYAVKYLTPQMK